MAGLLGTVTVTLVVGMLLFLALFWFAFAQMKDLPTHTAEIPQRLRKLKTTINVFWVLTVAAMAYAGLMFVNTPKSEQTTWLMGCLTLVIVYAVAALDLRTRYKHILKWLPTATPPR